MEKRVNNKRNWSGLQAKINNPISRRALRKQWAWWNPV